MSDASDVAEYTYDALIRRVEKIDQAANPDVTTRFYYDGWSDIEERDAGDAVTKFEKFLQALKIAKGVNDVASLYSALKTMHDSAEKIGDAATRLASSGSRLDCYDLCDAFFAGPSKAPVFGSATTAFSHTWCYSKICFDCK